MVSLENRPKDSAHLPFIGLYVYVKDYYGQVLPKLAKSQSKGLLFVVPEAVQKFLKRGGGISQWKRSHPTVPGSNLVAAEFVIDEQSHKNHFMRTCSSTNCSLPSNSERVI